MAAHVDADATSKVGVTCFTRILARDHPDLVFLAACCGATGTDMLKKYVAHITPSNDLMSFPALAVVSGEVRRFILSTIDR
jgi:hypothetical protein